LRDVLLHMAQFLDIDTITHYTSCKRRTIERILSDFRKTGSVARQHLRKGLLHGRRRATNGQDVQFLQGLVRHSPNVYLDEMRELLETRRGINVGKPTVWRALIRSGFTMKKASSFF
ncbi:hypothetical protein BYT27DRAFT_7008402, partial [Phlegmacium glaucopus]